ncbi:MAG: putative 4-hydroxybenzoate polyprenyltransferase [Candidatus Obscuribacterales bacterium]|nr:putative 4-hydroxybenzoate polyprenyltransferase [Candidatus Obscuribacterales bacterium]
MTASNDTANSPTLTATTKEWSEMIKLEHTVFALPFALSGLVLASSTLPGLDVVFWTILAFTGARAGAMTLNRLIDSKIDARNPRTSSRAIPAGRIKGAHAAIFAIVSFLIMLFAASHLPPLCLYLSPIALFWLSFYSYTKRLTWLCHIVLGIALGGAALGGWVAAGGFLDTAAPWLLALSVSTWVAGFDIIYACQDFEIDQKEKLHSIPSRFGIARALNISIALHVVTVTAMSLLGLQISAGIAFWAGLIMIGAMLFYEHSLVKPNDLSKVNAAFFNVNGVVSILAFFAILIDRIMQTTH